MEKRKVCIVVASRANYGRVKYVMKGIKEHPQLELQLVVGASTLLERFGKAVDIIKKDGFVPEQHLYYVVEGETLATQAKSTGLGIVELSTAFETLKPDIVVTVADRFETMATAIAATYMNIPLCHVQGGEVSGNIDDRVRNAITKLADVHFPCTEESKQRLIRMGEDEDFIFNYGCPAMDIVKNEDLTIDSDEFNKRYGGVGHPINWQDPYVLVVQHPVTTSYGHGFEQINETLEAVKMLKDYNKIVLWPNIDAGTDQVSKGIRVFRENNMGAKFHYYRNFSPEDYVKVVNGAKCCIGNSSSFIREGSFLGVPAVVVGDRQEGREHGNNVIFSEYDRNDIYQKAVQQMENKDIQAADLFGNGDAGALITEQLAKVQFRAKKKQLI